MKSQLLIQAKTRAVIALIAASVLLIALALTAHVGQRTAQAAADVAAPLANPVLSPGSTIVSGDITTNTTWTTAGSPYIVTSNIAVAVTATLTVEPGVEVQFQQYRALTVNGTLIAVGTASQPISFTATTKQPGWWYGIEIDGTASAPNTGSRLDYVTVEYGGRSNGNLYLYYATAQVTNSRFRSSSNDGIYGSSAGVAHIADSSFNDNGRYAIQFTDGSVNPVLARLSASGNGTNAIALGGGTLSGSHVWEALGIPYIALGNQTVAVSATLTVEPGVEVQFQQYRGLTVQGTLIAIGTASQPISFTGTTKQAGWWYGIEIDGTSGAPNTSSRLDYVTVEYGGRSNGNLYLYNATVQVSHSRFSSSSNDGIYGSSAGVAHIADSSFNDNGRYAIQFTDGSVNPSLARLVFSGNGTNAIALGSGTLTGIRTWKALGVPYLLLGSQTVAVSATLTVEPGVEAQFEQYRTLTVNGTLIAVGTITQPITFTATTKQAGWWYGIEINGTSNAPNSGSRLDYVTVEYGGRSYGNLYLYYATVPVSNSRFRNSGNDGIYGGAQGLAHVSDSSFSDNGRYPIQFTDGSVNPSLARLSASGNAINAIALGGGTLSGTHVWEALGIPYIATGSQTVALGATLTVEPGVEVQFEQYRTLTVNGTLIAVGTATQPITFTATFSGATKVPGWWYGIEINGTSNAPNSGSRLDYVTVEYGGRSYGNIYVYYGQVAVSHSVIRFSGVDGVYAATGGAAGSVIEVSQIVNNTNYGIRNTDPTKTLMATNNWWGSASGPMVDNNCNPSGTGSRASTGVAFRPFLASPTADPGPVAPSDTRILTITPWRWFAPADGISRLWVTMTLRTGDGLPLPGRIVRLNTTLGSVVDGGITNPQGQTFANVRSNTPGDATLTGILDVTESCESARSASANVTFTSTSDGAGALLPESQAPYLNNGIEIDPMPIVRGVRTMLRARLINPNNFPIAVDGAFSIVQAGIGLTFGPVGQVTGFIIAANSQAAIEVPWTPLISGHFCVQFEYSSRPAIESGAAPAQLGPNAGGSGRSQRNLNSYPGPLGSKKKNDSLEKADKAFKAVSKIPSGPTQIQKGLLGRWWKWAKETSRKISKELGGDPPRQDYKLIATPVRPSIPPVQPNSQISAARAAAINPVNDAYADVEAYGGAAAISFDRYGGAAAANDLQWSSQQSAALIYYNRALGTALVNLADRLDAFRQVLRNEGEQDYVVTADDVRVYQDRLRTQGFTADEINDAKLVGLTDADIEAIRQDDIAADPVTTAGSYLTRLADESAKARELGNTLLNPWDFGGGISISGGSGLLSQATTITESNTLARLFDTVSTIQIGNPLTQTTTIELRIRRIDLPSDWIVAVTPMTVTLAPGEQTTVTVGIRAGTATVQGTQPRVAVEGYANGQLLGGVSFDVIVPKATFFDGKLRSYLPLVIR